LQAALGGDPAIYTYDLTAKGLKGETLLFDHCTHP